MNYQRLRKANLIAKKRFLNWYPGMAISPKRLGKLRKNNVVCSCHSCRNPRRSHYFNGQEQLTIQERKAPGIDDWSKELLD